jgi:hypothetical protein
VALLNDFFSSPHAPYSEPLPSSLVMTLSLPARRSYEYNDGDAQGTVLYFQDANSFVLWQIKDPQQPIELSLSERLDDIFIEPSLELTFFSDVGISSGQERSLDDEVNPGLALYTPRLTQPAFERGLVRYKGETLMTRLRRYRPAGDLIVSGPLTARQVLAHLLSWLGVKVKNASDTSYTAILNVLPELLLFTSEGGESLFLESLVVQQAKDAEQRSTALDLIRKFFNMFPNYYFRGTSNNEFEVIVPPYAKGTLAINAWLYPSIVRTHRLEASTLTVYISGSIYLSLTASPLQPITSSFTLQHGQSQTIHSLGNFRVSYFNNVAAFVIDPPYYFAFSNSRLVSDLDYQPVLTLENKELGLKEASDIDYDSIRNFFIIQSQSLTFQDDQEIIANTTADGDYTATRVIKDPQTGNVLQASDWKDGTARTKLWPDAVNPISENFAPVPDGILVESEEITVSYQLDIAYTSKPVDWTVFGSDGKWSAPAGFGRQIRIDGVMRDLPFDGVAVLKGSGADANKQIQIEIDGQAGAKIYRYKGYVNLQWGKNAKGVMGLYVHSGFPGEIEYGGTNTFFEPPGGSPWIVASRFNFSVTGRALAQNDEILEVKYGEQNLDGTFEDGEINSALTQSQGQWDIRTFNLDLGPYVVSLDTMTSLAKQLAKDLIEPATRITLQVLPPYRVRPDMLGQAIAMPDNSTGLLTEFTYQESNLTPLSKSAGNEIVLRKLPVVVTPESSDSAFDSAAYGISMFS